MSDSRTVIVTGGTGGLGTAVVGRLLRDLRCVVLFIRQDGFDALMDACGESPGLVGLQADLSDEARVAAAVDEAAARYGGLYGLVHLAGGFAAGSVEESGGDVWQRMLSLNLVGAANAFRAVIPHLRREGSGRIIAVASEAALTKPAGLAAYTVSKSALLTLVEVTSKELQGSGVTVNAVAPGSMATPAMKGADSAELIPLDRVAETIAFLLSDAAASVNGSTIPLRP